MKIVEQFLPGSLGTIVALHGAHYARDWGFGTFFEAKVARELAQFAGRFRANDLVLLGVDEGGVAASLILDLNDPASGEWGAHLRWFIAADRCRGTGIGRGETLVLGSDDPASGAFARSLGDTGGGSFHGCDGAGPSVRSADAGEDPGLHRNRH
ncbi:MAG: hypothetical protein KC451_02775, partial [Amylibacter sp.]|nr:hypothetical protein [Amylibacter sp.]